jgi:hypothetical protein
LILTILAAAVVLYAVGIYNDLVSLRHITAAIQEIGNQLKRQADLFPI